MKIEFLTQERVEDFVGYCKKHKSEVDESFLYDEDLEDFKADEENPTYIFTNEQGKIIAAASLIIDEYNRLGKKARFRIFHSEIEDFQYFNMLMKEILKHTDGLEKLVIFIPLVNKKLMKVFEELDFLIERYSFLLVREDLSIPQFTLPKGYEIRAFRPGLDEEVWCDIRNKGFAKLKGSETPITPHIVTQMMSEKDYIKEGTMILYHNKRPVGIVRGSDDEYEGSPIMNIGPLAIIPEYQGKGLGRSLLRASLNIANEKGYDRTILCVNGENVRAKDLYIQEGFKQVEEVVCFKYDIKMK
ncbi:GNAT family N-acetyltransferase [Clostridium sp. D2Q-11]|uniref:GNAT family N-acetyltransferase n=1 Tax=Anaeromonas frigoriresistens TaxID=2683708 RepID=A0A942Z6I9_9FIRM|nr:GNAT family N-acetyltransferase [Anaeromonas frigoriresistens]MBS4538521.1 GNAT family N-acetyltransferase [Anaeromonas frigoriresistens]